MMSQSFNMACKTEVTRKLAIKRYKVKRRLDGGAFYEQDGGDRRWYDQKER